MFTVRTRSVVLAGVAAFVAAAMQMPSPPAKATVELGGKTVTISYSRPSVRGRKIMGGLVPYGEVWRTGANAATELDTPLDLQIGDLRVPAGKYTLYTLPGQDNWTLIVSKQTGQWGTEYSQAQDLGRTKMTVSKPPTLVEQFTISLPRRGDGAELVLEWENTRASVPVKATS